MKKVSSPEKLNHKGASLMEYAIVVALICIVSLAAISIYGQKVSQQFSSVASQI